MELGRGKSTFRRKAGNENYKRQKEEIEFVKGSGEFDSAYKVFDKMNKKILLLGLC